VSPTGDNDAATAAAAGNIHGQSSCGEKLYFAMANLKSQDVRSIKNQE
jgi:hypothetical protein